MRALRSASRCSKLHRFCVFASGKASTARRVHRCTTAVYLAPTEEHIQHLAALLARQRHAGDCYCLYGSVGAGKSVLSRAFIRAAAGDPQLPVPSPTYLLQLIYNEHDGAPIHHFDLYRLEQQQDMSRLDLGSSFSGAVSLVEWAERLPQQLLPEQRLEVRIQIMPDDSNSQQQQQQQQQQDLQELAAKAAAGEQGDVLVLPTPQLLSQHDPADLTAAAAAEYSLADTGDEEYEGAEDEYEEAYQDVFTDKRQRLVLLKGLGQKWTERLQQLAADMHCLKQQGQQRLQQH